MMKYTYLLLFVILALASCASNSSDLSFNKDMERMRTSNNETNSVSEIITVSFYAETNVEELGSFEVIFQIEPNTLILSEFMPVSNTGYKLTYSYNEQSGRLSLIGYSTNKIGKKGRFKIANLYFRKLEEKKYAALPRNTIKLYANKSYSPLPEQKEIDPSFSLALFEGYIQN